MADSHSIVSSHRSAFRIHRHFRQTVQSVPLKWLFNETFPALVSRDSLCDIYLGGFQPLQSI